MPTRERLTPERIRRFACPPESAQAFLWDTEAPRLAVRATAGGAKSYTFEAKLNRRTLRVTIGDVRAWNLDHARAEARRLQTMVDQGIDPRAEKAAKVAEAQQARAQKLAEQAAALDAWSAYIEDRRADWGERHLRNHQLFVVPGGEPRGRGRRKGEPTTTQPGLLHGLLSRPLAQIDAEAVKSWLEENNERRPTWTAQAFRALRAFMNWCAEHDEYSKVARPDACTQAKVRRKVQAVKAREDDCMQREQVPAWFREVRKLSNPVQAAYLQCLLLTGARRGELAALKWDDVDFQWQSLTIRDKVEGERTIPLTPYVSSLLAELKCQNETPPPEWRILNGKRIRNDLEHWKPSPFVFWSRSASGQIQEPRIAHNRALAAAGLPALTLHGLRRSFGTLAEWVECPAGISAQIMGHKPSALAEKHYRRRPFDLLRLWHTRIEAWILEQAEIEQPGEGDARLRVVTSNTAA